MDCIDEGRLGPDIKDLHEEWYSGKVSGQQARIDNFYKQAECIPDINMGGSQTVYLEDQTETITYLFNGTNKSEKEVNPHPGCDGPGSDSDSDHDHDGSDHDSHDDEEGDGDGDGEAELGVSEEGERGVRTEG